MEERANGVWYVLSRRQEVEQIAKDMRAYGIGISISRTHERHCILGNGLGRLLDSRLVADICGGGDPVATGRPRARGALCRDDEEDAYRLAGLVYRLCCDLPRPHWAFGRTRHWIGVGPGVGGLLIGRK